MTTNDSVIPTPPNGDVVNEKTDPSKPRDWDSSTAEAGYLATDEDYVDEKVEAAIFRKLDIRIVPMVMWVYLMNMMDRVNIGNARLFHLESDLKLKEGEFQIAVSVLFITYCLLEAPSNMIIKKMRPNRYLGALTLAWGITATFSAFVNNFASLLACRLLLGTFEAGFFPGVVLYLSMFYPRKRLALRVAYFFSTAAASGVLGGLVAYGISYMNGVGGWNAWRWIILINGIPTVLTAALIPWILPTSPETASFLTAQDKVNLKRIHNRQIGKAHNLSNMVWSDVKDGMKDWTTWAYCLALFPTLTMLYSFVVFLPTIIKGIGTWNDAEVQAMTAPVYAVGAITYVICAFYSDKTQYRGYFIMGSIASAIVGYAMLIGNAGFGVSYAGCFFVSVGIFISSGIAFAWVPTNNPRYGKRAFSTGMHLTIGNASGVASPFLFPTDQGPTYRPGYAASMGLLAFSFTLNLILHLHFKRQNKLRDEGKLDYLLDGKTEEEIEAMGERSPRFRFAI